MNDLTDRVFAGSGVDLVASLLESRPPSPDEIDAHNQARPAKDVPIYVHKLGSWPVEGASAYGEFHAGFNEEVPKTND